MNKHLFSNSNKLQFYSLIIFIVFSFPTISLFAQKGEQYLVGENQRLEMVVYIMGEIRKPGEYQIPESMNIVELLARAGGPTEFSDFSSITITRIIKSHSLDTLMLNTGKQNIIKNIIKFNVSKFLSKTEGNAIPKLRPGDIIFVPKNKWRTWRNVATIIRDVSVVATAAFLYIRATR